MDYSKRNWADTGERRLCGQLIPISSASLTPTPPQKTATGLSLTGQMRPSLGLQSVAAFDKRLCLMRRPTTRSQSSSPNESEMQHPLARHQGLQATKDELWQRTRTHTRTKAFSVWAPRGQQRCSLEKCFHWATRRKSQVEVCVCVCLGGGGEGACSLAVPRASREWAWQRSMCPLALVLQSHYISPLQWIAACPVDTPIQHMSRPL